MTRKEDTWVEHESDGIIVAITGDNCVPARVEVVLVAFLIYPRVVGRSIFGKRLEVSRVALGQVDLALLKLLDVVLFHPILSSLNDDIIKIQIKHLQHFA